MHQLLVHIAGQMSRQSRRQLERGSFQRRAIGPTSPVDGLATRSTSEQQAHIDATAVTAQAQFHPVPTLAQRQRQRRPTRAKGVGRIGVVMPGTTVHAQQGRPRVVEDDVVATGAHVDRGLQRAYPGQHIRAGCGELTA